MADTFFSQLDSAALRALLNRTALHDAALLTVGPTLYIEACNDAAAVSYTHLDVYKRQLPNGGEKPAIVRLIHITMPKWIRLIPIDCATGTSSGASRIIAAPPSKKHPMASSRMLTISKNRYGEWIPLMIASEIIIGIRSQVR